MFTGDFCFERLAATYSRGSYTTTTIGKTAFDGRVRDGNGSDHSFMATKIHAAGTPCGIRSGLFQPALPKTVKERMFPENYT